MGRVRTKTVKKSSRQVIERYYSRMTLDFHTNKKVLEEVAIIPSKRLRNKIAGFSTHLMKRIQKGPVRGISLKLQEEERERRMDFVPDVSAIRTDQIEVDKETLDMLAALGMSEVPGVVQVDPVAVQAPLGFGRGAGRSTYKTNMYMLPLLDFVGVTPTGMTFSVGFAYLEGEHVNNVIWALERFQGIFLRCDALPGAIVTERDLALMNAVKTVFLDCTNLLCRFHIDKKVKAKCKSLIGQKNAWDYVIDAWGSLVDCRSEHQFDDCLKKFEIACSP
ncbi:40S ribosomal protein S17-3 [Glycine soja]|uniref:40S ribosomal protein S17-3 n=1 Tax=Glycine soja TaxID=3848 RepID=A0A445IJG1_GLYSO|nr:40S ribosomal protein S17-3 [Glycine soja]